MQEQTIPVFQQRLTRLERRLRAFQVACLIGLVGLVLAACAMALHGGHTWADNSGQVLRLRGLIIEDEQGRERILLGAPVPKVAGRKRQDDATGLIVLGEKGADRVQLGLNPGPQCGGIVSRRISPASGITVNDQDGNERGGFGVLDNGRAILGLDYPTCQEAVAAFVLPDQGRSGFAVFGQQGKGDNDRVWLQTTKDGETSLRLHDTTSTKRVQLGTRGTAAPALHVYNEKGEQLIDLLGKSRP